LQVTLNRANRGFSTVVGASHVAPLVIVSSTARNAKIGVDRRHACAGQLDALAPDR
jgi:hypothetical protein